MLCRTTSYYPNGIDEMIFFQDNSLEKMDIINQYNKYISEGQYSKASNYISQQKGIYGYFADYFNAIENRIYKLQEYLLQKPPKKQPFIYYDEEVSFSIIGGLHIFTDSDEEEDLSSIVLFSNNDKEESIDNLFTFTGEEAEPPNVNKDTICI